MNKQTGVIRSTIYDTLNVLQIDGIIEKDQNNKGLFKIIKYIFSCFNERQNLSINTLHPSSG